MSISPCTIYETNHVLSPVCSRRLTQVITLCRKHPGIQHLNVRGVRGLDENLFEGALRQLVGLESLVMGYQNLQDVFLHRTRTHCPRLKRLEITEPILPPGPPTDLNFVHPNLTVTNHLKKHCQTWELYF